MFLTSKEMKIWGIKSAKKLRPSLMSFLFLTAQIIQNRTTILRKLRFQSIPASRLFIKTIFIGMLILSITILSSTLSVHREGIFMFTLVQYCISIVRINRHEFLGHEIAHAYLHRRIRQLTKNNLIGIISKFIFGTYSVICEIEGGLTGLTNKLTINS